MISRLNDNKQMYNDTKTKVQENKVVRIQIPLQENLGIIKRTK